MCGLILQIINFIFIIVLSYKFHIQECQDHKKDLLLRTKNELSNYYNWVDEDSELIRNYSQGTTF